VLSSEVRRNKSIKVGRFSVLVDSTTPFSPQHQFTSTIALDFGTTHEAFLSTLVCNFYPGT